MAVRTTLTLDDDVARRLQVEAKRTGRTWKDVVNDVLRRGLEPRAPAKRPPLPIPSRALGLRPGVSLECTSRLLDELDEHERRERGTE